MAVWPPTPYATAMQGPTMELLGEKMEVARNSSPVAASLQWGNERRRMAGNPSQVVAGRQGRRRDEGAARKLAGVVASP